MQRVNVQKLPYVQAVVDGSLDLHDFVRTQVQFFFAVAAYPKNLALLAERIQWPEAKRALEDNVRDELGRGTSAHSHVQTFRALLRKLGVTDAEIDGSHRWPCVETFNEGVRAACVDQPAEAGLATVAAIEDLFTHISQELGAAIADRGWLSRDEVVHYNVHRELDREHADALYGAIDTAKDASVPEVTRGVAAGVSLMTELYDGLLLKAK